ncbi:MAG: hypothetical protein ACYDCL_21495 [Myxococcales bacterium]
MATLVAPARRRELLIGGGVIAAAAGGFFVLRARSAAAAATTPTAPAAVSTATPTSPLSALAPDPGAIGPSGAGASSGGAALTAADLTSALAAAVSAGQSQAAGLTQNPIGGTTGIGQQVPGAATVDTTPTVGTVLPTAAPTTPASPAATQAGTVMTPTGALPLGDAAMLDASVIAGERAGYTPAQSGAGAAAPFAGLAAAHGLNGVFGTNTPTGVSYTVFKNGVPVATVPGTGTTDAAALATQYGVNPNAFGITH